MQQPMRQPQLMMTITAGSGSKKRRTDAGTSFPKNSADAEKEQSIGRISATGTMADLRWMSPRNGGTTIDDVLYFYQNTLCNLCDWSASSNLPIHSWSLNIGYTKSRERCPLE